MSESRHYSVRLITSSYLPIVGGSEVEAQRVCSGLLQRGHAVEVFCPGGPQMPAEPRRIDPWGIPVRQFGTTANLRVRGYVFAIASAWVLWRDRSRYDLMYFLMTGAHVVSGCLVARLTGKPVIMKFSGSNTIRPLLASPVGRLQLKLLSRWAFRIMVLNDAMRQEGAECGLDRSKFLWMPNPVDTQQFRPVSPEERLEIRQRLGVDPATELLVFVGRLAPEKELDSLIEAFVAVARQRPLSQLVLVGDGPCRKTLEAQVAQSGLEQHVRLVGAQPGDRVRTWLQAADGFALVSSLEGLPVSLLEAMAVGLPAVVSDIPANLQLVTEENGLVAKLRDVGSLSAAVVRLLGDPVLRSRFGEAARKRVEYDYSTATVVKRYEELFAEATEAVR